MACTQWSFSILHKKYFSLFCFVPAVMLFVTGTIDTMVQPGSESVRLGWCFGVSRSFECIDRLRLFVFLNARTEVLHF